MKPLLLEPYFIFILLLIISTNTPTCLCEDDVKYTNCSSSFSCGNSNNLNLKYPFWGGNREKYCGVPELEKLTCEDEATKISVNGIKYRILGWNDRNQILTVARDDYWSDSICVSSPKNNSFDNTSFQYADGGLVNVTILYDCSSPPSSIMLTSVDLPNINCTGGKMVYYTVLNVPSSVAAICTVVVIPISETERSLVESANGISDALNGGFDMKWTGKYNENCKTCTESGGECGSSNEEFQCFCEDGPNDTKCKGMLAC